MLRVLTLSTLFPDETRPHFGPFVELQTRGLAAHPDVDLRVVAPVGIAPLGQFHPRYRALTGLPEVETWKGLSVYRPRFTHVPGTGGRFDVKAMSRALVRPLQGIREQFPFDVIDAEFFFPDGPAAIELGRAFNVPVSIKARGADIHFWGRENPATRHQVLAAGQAAAGMLAVSAALKADMVALGMPEERIMVHYTGVDRARFYVRDRAEAKAALGVSGPSLVSVGNLVPRKGHGIVIDALTHVPDATLVIIGSGETRSALEAQILRLGLAPRVRLLGSQPHDVIADWLAAADAMVLVSSSEGLANSWVESLASGTPVVISDVGGARELLDRPEAGLLTDANAEAVASAIQSVLVQDFARDAVAATVGRFSWEANAAALYEHLTAVAARR
jgi:teichuronic acid biosynthesis glycosyltransferase TuaC